jgi:hypothetical protein
VAITVLLYRTLLTDTAAKRKPPPLLLGNMEARESKENREDYRIVRVRIGWNLSIRPNSAEADSLKRCCMTGRTCAQPGIEPKAQERMLMLIKAMEYGAP